VEVFAKDQIYGGGVPSLDEFLVAQFHELDVDIPAHVEAVAFHGGDHEAGQVILSRRE